MRFMVSLNVSFEEHMVNHHNAKEGVDLSFLRAGGMMQEEERRAVTSIIEMKEGEEDVEKKEDIKEEEEEEEEKGAWKEVERDAWKEVIKIEIDDKHQIPQNKPNTKVVADVNESLILKNVHAKDPDVKSSDETSICTICSSEITSSDHYKKFHYIAAAMNKDNTVDDKIVTKLVSDSEVSITKCFQELKHEQPAEPDHSLRLRAINIFRKISSVRTRIKDEHVGNQIKEEPTGNMIKKDSSGGENVRINRGYKIHKKDRSNNIKKETEDFRIREEVRGKSIEEKVRLNKIQEEAKRRKIDGDVRDNMRKEQVRGTQIKENIDVNQVRRPDSGFSESPIKRPGSVEINPSPGKRIKTEPCELEKQLIEQSSDTRKHTLKCAFCTSVFSNRSALYGHYSTVYYRKEIMKQVGDQRNKCSLCGNKFLDIRGLVKHYGRGHNMVEDFLPIKHHVPLSDRATSLVKNRSDQPNAWLAD